MKKIMLIIYILLNMTPAMAQETENLFDFRNFDYQAYQIKLQKFLETLTPQERIIFVMSQNKNSSNSSKECELDSGIERKIDDIYKKVKDIDDNLFYGMYYKIKCE